MRRRTAPLLAFLILFSVTADRVHAQAARDDAATGLEKEIAHLNRSLEQVIALLREGLETQRLEILLKRVELNRLDLVPLQDDIRTLQSDQSTLQGEQDQIRSRLDDVENQLASRREEIPQPPSEDLLTAKREYESRLKFLKSRIQENEARVLELENELSSKRRQIEILESMVDERLGLRK